MRGDAFAYSSPGWDESGSVSYIILGRGNAWDASRVGNSGEEKACKVNSHGTRINNQVFMAQRLVRWPVNIPLVVTGAPEHFSQLSNYAFRPLQASSV